MNDRGVAPGHGHQCVIGKGADIQWGRAPLTHKNIIEAHIAHCDCFTWRATKYTQSQSEHDCNKLFMVGAKNPISMLIFYF